jgi:hypothetical protein
MICCTNLLDLMPILSKVIEAFLYEGNIFLFFPISFPHPFLRKNQIAFLKIQKNTRLLLILILD